VAVVTAAEAAGIKQSWLETAVPVNGSTHVKPVRWQVKASATLASTAPATPPARQTRAGSAGRPSE
jgi:hypothetical protein